MISICQPKVIGQQSAAQGPTCIICSGHLCFVRQTDILLSVCKSTLVIFVRHRFITLPFIFIGAGCWFVRLLAALNSAGHLFIGLAVMLHAGDYIIRLVILN
jgi:hypothetical protein